VTGGGSVTNASAWVAVYAPNGTPADGALTGTWNITGVAPGDYILRLYHYSTWETTLQATTVWTSTYFYGGSAPPPANQPPGIAWTGAPGSVAHGQAYTISAHGNDADGNLAQVNIWKDGQPFALAGGGNGTDGDSSNPSTDAGPQTITFTAQAVDSTGATSAVIMQTVTVAAPPPAQYTLITTAVTGGSVSPGGTYNAGTVVTVTATPDGTHDFAGWSGDAGGTGNPINLLIDTNKSVQANFSPKVFALTTSATTGGNVTPGGTYPYGSSVTVSATPDATHRFIGWAGDASGSAPSVLVTLTSPLNVQAVFTDKTAQTITFPSPGNQPVGGPASNLGGSASSGLPVTYTILSGPATVTGNQLQVTGPGTVTVQASQPGDATYLPAANVNQTFNTVAAAFLKYRPAGRTLLQDRKSTGSAPFVLEKP